MSWKPVTTAAVMARFNNAELAALQSIQGSAEQLGNVLDDVRDTVRGHIIAGGNRLGPAGTTPDQLKIHIVSMAIWLWLTGFSKNEKLQTDARQKNYTAALDALKEIASGKIKVEIPEEPADAPGPVGPVKLVTANPRRARRGQTSGL
jgi:hypothetical protein